jgi:hypothetical protein
MQEMVKLGYLTRNMPHVALVNPSILSYSSKRLSQEKHKDHGCSTTKTQTASQMPDFLKDNTRLNDSL